MNHTIHLVTGATGLLGSVLTLRLLQEGHTVRAAVRAGSDTYQMRASFSYHAPDDADRLWERIQWVTIDLHDQDSLYAALQGVTHVYHTAAKVSFDPRDQQELMDTNVTGTQQLLYVAQDMPQLQLLVHISSIAVLDVPNDAGVLDEDSAYNPKIPHSTYALSKHLSEMDVWRAHAEGLPTLIFNPGIILGPTHSQQSSGELLPGMLRRSWVLPGTTGYVDVRDVADAIVQGISQPQMKGQRYVLVGQDLSFVQLDQWIKQHVGRPQARLLPAWLLHTLVPIGKLFSWMVPSLARINKASVQAVTSTTPISGQRILQDLPSYRYRPVHDTVIEYLAPHIHA